MGETILQPEASSETFSSYRGNRGGSAEPVPDQAKPVETESTNSAAAQPQVEVVPKLPTDSETVPKQEKFEKRKQEIQREIDDLVKKRETLKRDATAAEAQLVAVPKRDAVTYDGTDKDDLEPKSESYETWQKFADARAAWVARNEFRRLEHDKAEKTRIYQQTAQETAFKERQAENTEQFEERATEYAKDHSDFNELYAEIKKRPTLPNEIAFAVTDPEEDMGPELLHHLMTNPDEIERIDKIQTISGRYRALYALKFDLLKAKELKENKPAEEKPRSGAPRPGTVLNGSGGGASGDVKTFSQFRKQPPAKRYT